jgi:hypothetical protein
MTQRRPDEFLLDELTDQLDRTRRLLTGSPEEAAERALARMGALTEVEARLAAELAVSGPLADTERFPPAHRLVMRALEVHDREGFRHPGVRGLGPLKPLAELAIEFVSEYIVKSYTKEVVNQLRSLYARREAQCPPDAPERRLLARSRVEVDRLAPSFGGGGLGAPALLAGGAVLPVLASATQYVGAVDWSNRGVLLIGIALLFVVFFSLSWVLLQGAAVAGRRSRLILRRPLTALWETIGHAGGVPEDSSQSFAIIAVVLTGLVWLVLPVLIAVVLLV